jgi:hypothetical protein
MKHLKFITPLLLLCSLTVAAQTIPDCSTIPLTILPGQATFSGTNVSFGDSAYTIPVVNNSTDYYAYPCLRPEFLNPLPQGTTLSAASNGFTPFASSFNPGDTMPYSAFFNVTQPIPANYTVTIRFWGGNLTPANPDSCVFGQPVIVNLNPQAIPASIDGNNEGGIYLFPNPATNQFSIEGVEGDGNVINVYDIACRRMLTQSLSRTTKTISCADFDKGLYVVTISVNGNINYCKKLLIQ